MAQDSRPCKGCGVLILRTVPVAPVRHYCTPECRPRCAIDGCDKPTRGNVYCTQHHTRWKRTGDPLTPLTRQRNEGSCSVEGCDQPMRKTGWCAGHYAQQWKTMLPPEPFTYKWSDSSPCLVCGEPRGHKYRQFCSAACYAFYSAYNGFPPTERTCVACGGSIDLTVRSQRGNRTKASIKLCRPCKQDYRKYKLSARELAVRDGANCGICGEPVDMELKRSDSLMCPSVDHIIPRAKGGTHEPDNLQLAHLYCNHVKSDRVALTPKQRE